MHYACTYFIYYALIVFKGLITTYIWQYFFIEMSLEFGHRASQINVQCKYIGTFLLFRNHYKSLYNLYKKFGTTSTCFERKMF